MQTSHTCCGCENCFPSFRITSVFLKASGHVNKGKIYTNLKFHRGEGKVPGSHGDRLYLGCFLWFRLQKWRTWRQSWRKDVAIYFKPGVWHLDLVAPFLCEDMPRQTHGLCHKEQDRSSTWPFYVGLELNSVSILDVFPLLAAFSNS